MQIKSKATCIYVCVHKSMYESLICYKGSSMILLWLGFSWVHPALLCCNHISYWELWYWSLVLSGFCRFVLNCFSCCFKLMTFKSPLIVSAELTPFLKNSLSPSVLVKSFYVTPFLYHSGNWIVFLNLIVYI